MSSSTTRIRRRKIKGRSLNETISNLEDEMHLYHPIGEYVPGGSFNGLKTYSYCGPGTKFIQRYREGYRGVNALDYGCMFHDLFYTIYKDPLRRNKSDVALAQLCDELLNDPEIDEQQKKDARTVKLIMSTKARFAL